MASATSSSTFSIPNISTLVSVKLSETNYLPWESQVKPFLIGQNLWRFVDGTHPCPPLFITTPAPAASPTASVDSDVTSTVVPPVVTTTPNPDYLVWYQTDQTLVSLLRATLTEPVLSLTVGLSTSREIWEHLCQNFSQQSLANSTHNRFQLLSLQKGNQTIAEYLGLAKHLADQLASIGQPVQNDDLVTYVLNGLGPEYEMLVLALTNFPPLPSFNDLRTRLLVFESKHAMKQVAASSHSAFYFARHTVGGSSNGRGGHSSSRPNGASGGNRFPRTPSGGRSNQHGGVGRYGQRGAVQQRLGILGPAPVNRGPQCWACNQFGHIAALCPQATRSNDDISRAFAGMHLASPSDPTWYPDTGATHHMTSDARTMTSATRYGSHDKVVVGSGEALPIAHTGNISFESGSFIFRLSQVLHVPAIKKNLLSVAKFTRDNLVSLTFFPWGFVIRDLKTGVVLFQGPCEDGLYPIKLGLASRNWSAPKRAFVSVLASSSLWHRRLGHPSRQVLSVLASSDVLGSSFSVSNKNFCNHCALAKSHRLSFHSSEHYAKSPFELIHSDVWMSPIL